MPKATPVLLLAGTLCVSACATPRFLTEAENARTNTHIALAFEETVFNKHRVQEGFSRYVAADYREHDAGLPEADSHLIVQRSIAQHDLVAIDALWNRRAEEGADVARVDIYRLENGKIAEHWSVQQSAPSPAASGGGQPNDGSTE